MKNIRIHYEWVWDGSTVKIVQADIEVDDPKAVNPNNIPFNLATDREVIDLNCLRVIDENFPQKFRKIHNPILYRKLKLETTNLYILDDISILNDLRLGIIGGNLFNDLKNILQTALVIRMDINTDDINIRQLLPRSDELRTVEEAINWLIENSRIKQLITHSFVFIIHNFIPALASAFAYAAPNERIVQIEALWGIPEGLYYNAHDKYIVDTGNKDFNKIPSNSLNQLKVKVLRYAKKYFVAPDKYGKWVTHILENQFIWRSTIQRKETLRKIAFQSRAIAEKEQKHLSIMWFIGLGKNDASTIMPWHHEEIDPSLIQSKKKNRQKRNFEKSFIVKTFDDVNEIKKSLTDGDHHYSSLKIKPDDEKLLRDKDTLQIIGGLAKNHGIIIIMEGSILSHAYYQLCKTGAVVEVENIFKYEGEKSFNKLVRDKIPGNIISVGESVQIAEIKNDDFINLLKRKLVEESFEALDAHDYDSLVGEIADIKELIDTIMRTLGISKEELYQSQKTKRKKAGGFEKGYVLLKTDNPIPIAPTKIVYSNKDIDIEQLYGVEILERESSVRKNWKDQQNPSNNVDILRARINVPILKDSWKISTQKRKFSFSDIDLFIQTDLVGSRTGRDIQIDVLLNILQQHKLFRIPE